MFQSTVKILLIFFIPLLTSCGGVDEVVSEITTEERGCQYAHIIKQEMTILINEARATSRYCGNENFQEANPVLWNEQLYQAAYSHSQDMSSGNFFSHTGSDGSDTGKRIEITGYIERTYGENIAAGFTNSKNVVDGWLDSPEHCTVVMHPSFAEIGAACAENESADYGTYWTLVLASSR